MILVISLNLWSVPKVESKPWWLMMSRTIMYPSHKYPLKLYENAPPYTPFHFEPKDNQGTWCVFALLTLISLPTNSEVLSDLF